MSSMIKHEQQKQELDYYKNLAMIASKSGTTSMTPDIMMNIMLTAKDLGISPMKAINGGFYVVNGKISMSTALMADRIRKEGHSIKIPEWTNQKCVMIGVRKDNGDSVKFEFTMEDAQAAGLLGSPTWKKFPKQMLYNRAMSTLARTLFPDVVGNAYSEDEKWDIMGTPADKRPLEDPDNMEIASIEIKSSEGKEGSLDRMQQLTDLLEKDQIPTEHLDSYLSNLAKTKGQEVELILEAAIQPQVYPKFKVTYTKFISKQTEESDQVVA